MDQGFGAEATALLLVVVLAKREASGDGGRGGGCGHGGAVGANDGDSSWKWPIAFEEYIVLVLEGPKKRVWILNSNEVKNVSLQDEKRLWDRFNFIMWILFL